jgi:tubby-related protein 1
MLNFHGRVECPSIKNFILEDREGGSEVLLFGKINDNSFNLDVTAPMSPLLATAVALSSFDSRMMCE